MVLEESLLFIDDADADLFIKFLKGKNCRAQKRHEGHVVEETLMVGSLSNLIAMLEERIAADPESYCEPPEDDKDLLFMTLLESVDDRERTNAVMIPLMLAEAKQAWKYISYVNSRFNEGEVFSTSMLPLDSELEKQSLERMIKGNSRDELVSCLGEIFFQTLHLKIMQRNNLIEEGPEGVILLRKVNPDDVSIEYQVTDLELIDIEAQEAHHISLVRRVNLSIRTRVSIDPSLYCTGILDDEILEAVSPLSGDEESIDHLLYNFYYKRIVVEQIIDLIAGAEKISLSAIIEQVEPLVHEVLNDPEEEGEIESIARITPEFITSLVGDLRKIGMIRGNDTKIRLSLS